MRQVVLFMSIAALLPSCATTRNHQYEAGGEDVSITPHPLGSGSVEFVGFSSEELQAFRVIPEDGGDLFAPRDSTRIADVDGFWWKSSESFWFKIPDHCHSSISKVPDGLMSSPHCSKLGTRVQKLRRQPHKPGWQKDEGRTAHGTDYPF